MVKHSREPGIKGDFMGTFLKPGSACLLSPLRIIRQKQTPVHLGERGSPRKGTILGCLRQLGSSLARPLLIDGAADSQRQILKHEQNTPRAAKEFGLHTGVQKARTKGKKGPSSSGDH